MILRGIANSGNGKAFDAVLPFLSERSATLREAAVDALRLMLGPRVESVLLSALENDESDSVKVAAADACGMREPHPTLVRAIATASAKDKSTRVRQRAVQVLSAWAPRNAQAAAALKAAAAFESNPRVQAQAAGAPK